MTDILFSEEHEWVRVDGDVATCGISEYAQVQLGDVVFVDLPTLGAEVNKDDDCAVVELSKQRVTFMHLSPEKLLKSTKHSKPILA